MDWLRVEGASMRPFLEPGDAVAVDWGAACAVGEIVVARDPSDGGFVVHRVIPAPGGPRLKGDAAFVADSFDSGAVWGRAVAVRDTLDRERAVRVTRLDRLIAALSARALPAERLSSRVLRKAVFVLGWLRREWA